MIYFEQTLEKANDRWIHQLNGKFRCVYFLWAEYTTCNFLLPYFALWGSEPS